MSPVTLHLKSHTTNCNTDFNNACWPEIQIEKGAERTDKRITRQEKEALVSVTTFSYDIKNTV